MRKKKQNIDGILRTWPYDPDSVSVRLVQGDDGRDLIQMRIEMGLLQLETTGRPDGQRPEGAETYYDFLLDQSIRKGEHYVLNEEQCAEADREFVQFYHRRICWLAMREFAKAVKDADHTLGLMDLCRSHSPDDQWTVSHEQYRPFVLFHRIQAAALAELDSSGPEAAVQAVNQGLERLRGIFVEHGVEDDFPGHEMVERLTEFRETLRDKFAVGRTLQEQLADAIAAEEYERAAKLRDVLRKRGVQS
jgi:hypothetical protein